MADNEPLRSLDDYKKREKHHIFPKSKLQNKIKDDGNCALNCLLVPKKDNIDYSDELPGDYIRKLFKKTKKPLPEIDIVNRLETHLISKRMAETLVQITQDEIDKGENTLEDAYNKFIDERAHDVDMKIKRMLR